MADELEQPRTILLTEEELRVEKRMQASGRKVRVAKRVVEVPVAVDEDLIRESLTTERIPIGRVIDGPQGIRQEGDVTIVPVVEERLVVRKEWVLVEEWRITRRKEVARFQHEELLRRDEISIEVLDAQGQASDGTRNPVEAQVPT